MAGVTPMRRRQFLKTTSLLAAGTLSLPSSLHAKAGSKRYDVIIVGAGAAGSIVAKRLVDRFPRKTILLLEAGGPTSVTVGGRDFPPYDRQATIFDVPGEYTNIAFQPKGEPYRQPETPFTYQGTGYGGNSQFNGMLFQAHSRFLIAAVANLLATALKTAAIRSPHSLSWPLAKNGLC